METKRTVNIGKTQVGVVQICHFGYFEGPVSEPKKKKKRRPVACKFGSTYRSFFSTVIPPSSPPPPPQWKGTARLVFFPAPVVQEAWLVFSLWIVLNTVLYCVTCHRVSLIYLVRSYKVFAGVIYLPVYVFVSLSRCFRCHSDFDFFEIMAEQGFGRLAEICFLSSLPNITDRRKFIFNCSEVVVSSSSTCY